MRGTIINTTEKLVVEDCCNCGVTFAMPLDLRDERLKWGDNFFCPNGHSMSYTETEVEKLRRDNKWYADRLTKERAAHDQAIAFHLEQRTKTERKLRGTKAVVTRMKRRMTAGRCVCCSKEFKDLKRHMKNQHPNFDPDKAAEALAESGKAGS